MGRQRRLGVGFSKDGEDCSRAGGKCAATRGSTSGARADVKSATDASVVDVEITKKKMWPTKASAFALILLISEAAQTVQHKKKKCERLARRCRMIGACLRQLQNLDLVHNPESMKLIELLEETLCQIHKVVRACQNTRISYHFSARKLADQFREVQGKIDFYLIAFPTISQAYMACKFAGATAHLAEAQEQCLLTGSPHVMEEGPPPPSISIAAFNFVLNKAFTYLDLYDINEGVEALKDRLLRSMGEIQVVLDSIDYLEIKEKSTEFCTWMWPLRDAIEEVEDAADSMAYYEHEIVTGGQKMPHKVHDPISIFVKGKNVRAAKAVSGICLTRLKKAVVDLDEVATDTYLFLDSKCLGAPHCSHETGYTFENNHGAINNVVIGREIEKGKIIFWLTQRESVRNDHGLSVFAIHGQGGMGKTALARLVYRDEEVRESFDSMVWLHIPKNFDAETMTSRILESIANWIFSYNTLQELQNILISELSTKKFFLILDGVQCGDRIDEWEKLMVPLRYGLSGSRILLTTRELSAVNVIEELTGAKLELLHLDGLSYDDNLMLFQRSAFAGSDPEICSAISPGISEANISLAVERIVERFEGCPLLTKVLGGCLGDNMLAKHLKEIIRLMGYDEYTSDTIHLLKLCYHGLPAHIQACFRYCSIFPREYKFSKEELLKLWMGSGLVPEISDTKEKPEDIGQVYLDTLVRRSFIDKIVIANLSAEDQECYVVPSLMYDMAQHFSIGECARVNTSDLEHVNGSVRHLYIAQHGLFNSDKLKPISRLKHLRTLIVEGDLRDPKAETLLGEILKGLTCLRLLSLPSVSSSSFLDEVINLVHLRYLSLFKCDRLDLCKVFQLYHLRLLKILLLAAEVNDFDGITGLHHLRYLDVPGNCFLKITQIGSLSELQELDNFVIRETEGCRLSSLENLSGIQRLGLHEMENIADCQEVAKFKLNRKTQLKSLSLTWDTHPISDIDDQILNALEPPRGLEELHIIGYGGCIPSWMVNESVLKLVSLEIKDCTKWECIPSLAALQFLKHLRLDHLSSLRCIGHDIEAQIESDAFAGTYFPPSLETLAVELCPKLKRLPDLPLSLIKLVLELVGLEFFPNIDLSFANNKPNGSSSLLQSRLASLHIENCPDLPALNGGLFQQQEHLGSLQVVVIKRCENLEYLPSCGFSSLVQLKHLGITYCPALRMGRDTENDLLPMSLEYFDISCCGCAEVPMLISLQSVALRRLNLFSCDNVKNLPSEEVFKALDGLHEISIVRCRNLLSLGGLGAAGSLRLLTIACCEKLEVSESLESLLVDDKSKKNMVNCSVEVERLKIDRQDLLLVEPLMYLRNTQELHICNDDGMTCLPKNWLLRNRDSLRSIVIRVADYLLTLPSYLRELEHLETLHIERASMVKSIPDMPASMRKLNIWGCHPLLLERCQKDVGPDWPKIANIHVDLQPFSRVSTEELDV